MKAATLSISITDILRYAYVTTYPADGYDPVNNTQNGRNDASREYMFHYLTLLTTFLGLPNRDLNGEGTQTLLNVAKNFIGWEDQVTTSRWVFNIIKVLPISLWHAAMAVIVLLTNIVKILTEFAPLFFATLAKHTASLVYEMINNQVKTPNRQRDLQTHLSTIGLVAAFIFLEFAHYLLDVVYIVGRIITSPHTSVRVGWRRGLQLAGNTWAGWILGGVLATISIVLTVLIYAIALPIAAKYAVAITIPHVPAFIMTAVSWATSHILPVLAVVAKAVFMPIVAPIFKWMGIVVSPPIVALSAIAGTTITTVGTITTKLIEDFKNWWFACAKKTYKDVSVIPIIIKNNHPPSPKITKADEITPLLTADSSRSYSQRFFKPAKVTVANDMQPSPVSQRSRPT